MGALRKGWISTEVLRLGATHEYGFRVLLSSNIIKQWFQGYRPTKDCVKIQAYMT